MAERSCSVIASQHWHTRIQKLFLMSNVGAAGGSPQCHLDGEYPQSSADLLSTGLTLTMPQRPNSCTIKMLPFSLPMLQPTPDGWDRKAVAVWDSFQPLPQQRVINPIYRPFFFFILLFFFTFHLLFNLSWHNLRDIAFGHSPEFTCDECGGRLSESSPFTTTG